MALIKRFCHKEYSCILKFSKSKSNSKVTVTRSNIFVPKTIWSLISDLWSIKTSNKDALCQVLLKLTSGFGGEFHQVFFAISLLSRLGKGHGPLLEQTWIPFSQEKLCAKFGWNWPSDSNGKAILNLPSSLFINIIKINSCIRIN